MNREEASAKMERTLILLEARAGQMRMDADAITAAGDESRYWLRDMMLRQCERAQRTINEGWECVAATRPGKLN